MNTAPRPRGSRTSTSTVAVTLSSSFQAYHPAGVCCCRPDERRRSSRFSINYVAAARNEAAARPGVRGLRPLGNRSHGVAAKKQNSPTKRARERKAIHSRPHTPSFFGRCTPGQASFRNCLQVFSCAASPCLALSRRSAHNLLRHLGSTGRKRKRC